MYKAGSIGDDRVGAPTVRPTCWFLALRHTGLPPRGRGAAADAVHRPVRCACAPHVPQGPPHPGWAELHATATPPGTSTSTGVGRARRHARGGPRVATYHATHRPARAPPPSAPRLARWGANSLVTPIRRSQPHVEP